MYITDPGQKRNHFRVAFKSEAAAKLNIGLAASPLQAERARVPKGLKSVHDHVYKITASDEMSCRRFGFDAFGSLAGFLLLSSTSLDGVAQQLAWQHLD